MPVAYTVGGHKQADAPLFSGSAAHPTSLAVFACAPHHILTNSLSDFVAIDSAHDTWACGVAASGALEWRAWKGDAFVPGISGLPRCVEVCAASPCSSAATPAVVSTDHFSECYDNHGKQKFRCTCLMGWQGEKCDVDVDECAHTRYSENCEAACETESECEATAQGLPAGCSRTGFALASNAGQCNNPYWVDLADSNKQSGCDRDGDGGIITNCHNRNGSWACGACLEQPSCCKDSSANIRASGTTPWHMSGSYVLCDPQPAGSSMECPDVAWEQPGCTGRASAASSSVGVVVTATCTHSQSECTCHTNPKGDHSEVYPLQGAAECSPVGSSVTISIDPEDQHGRKTGNNTLTLLSVFNITLEQVSGLPGLHRCDSQTVRSSMVWVPTAKSMHDREGEYQGVFSCATAGLYVLTVRIGDGVLAQGGAQQILIVPDKAYLNNTLAQLKDSPGWCVEADEGPRCRTMPGRSNKIVVRVRDVYGNERRRSSLQEGPAGDVVLWSRQTVGGRPCEDCHVNTSKHATWDGDVVDGAYGIEFSFQAKIEHEFDVVMTLNGQSWGALTQADMEPDDSLLTPALRGISRFRYALHTNLDPRACTQLNCSNFISQQGSYPAIACRNAGCMFAAGTPTIPNQLSLVLDWDRKLLGNINVTVTRDVCNGPSFDPSTGLTRKPVHYWEEPGYCTTMRANATDIIQCGHPLQQCMNVPPVRSGSNSTGIVEIYVNHPGLYRVNVETTSNLPASSGGGKLTLRLPTRQLSIGPGPADHTASTVHPASILNNQTTSGSRKLGRYELDKPGEGYNFSFSVLDSEQNARTGRDELVVEVTRVDPRELEHDPETKPSAAYQPEKSSKYPFNVTYTTAALRRHAPASQETDCKTDTVCIGELPYGDRYTGIFTFNQSLFEFGVYKVKAWVCTKDSLNDCLSRTNALSETYTFTVCPQNTDVSSDLGLRDIALNGTLEGAALDKCQCKAGVKSPAGTGENCNACARGQFQTAMGERDCGDCVAGTFCGCSSEYASVDSEKCAEAAWNPACSLCDACATGKFQNKEGRGVCRTW